MDIERIVDTVKKLYPVDPVPLHAPVFKGFEMDYLETVIRIPGNDFIFQFEEEVNRVTNARYCVATGTGTGALHIALLVAGVKLGDKVITTPLTFVATCNAISYCGAQPVFVDIDKTNFGMDPDKLEILLASGERFSACVPVHVFGHSPWMDRITDLCMQYGIPVIEDAAEAIGSLYRGAHAGTWGKAGILSFNWNKTVTSGGGGMILTDDKDFSDRARHLINVAKVDDPWMFRHDMIGFNYRMSNLNAAVGVAQMERISEILANKRSTAELYFEAIPQMFHASNYSRPNYWLNTLICDRKEQVEELHKAFDYSRIQARPAWTLMHKLPMYKDCPRMSLEVAEDIGDRIVNLPSGVRW
jgi:dTDP-4-amino-4,6-dideoxygalactose transaminase